MVLDYKSLGEHEILVYGYLYHEGAQDRNNLQKFDEKSIEIRIR